MITIGLPKALFYYQHNLIWEKFFRNIGCNVVLSHDTNKEILDIGVKYCSNETCLPVKVFHGHVLSLADKADYIFIPRYISLAKNEFACPKFCGLPDMAKLNLKIHINILEIQLNLDNSIDQTYETLKALSKRLNINYKYVIEVFDDAFTSFKQEQNEISTNNNTFKETESTNNLVISVLGHPYMIHDNYLSMNLIKKLTDRNVSVYTPMNLNHEIKRENAYPYYGKAFWEVGFDNLGSAFTFAGMKNVKGIIYLTPFACGVDSFVLEFIERRLQSYYNIPFMKLTVDEHTGEAGFDTRIEAFLDMVGE